VAGATAADRNGLLPEQVFPQLEEVLMEAVGRSWRMVEEGLREVEARGEGKALAGPRYPTVVGAFRYTGRLEERDDFDRTRSFYQPQASLTARQTLYDWGAGRASSRLGEIRIALAVHGRAEAYRLLALEVRSGFLELAVLEEEIRLGEVRLGLARLERAAAEAAWGRGELTEEELALSRLAAREVEFRYKGRIRERAHARADFVRLTGWTMENGWEWPTEFPVWEVGPKGGVEERMVIGDYMPWREGARGRIEQAEAQYLVERARDRPRLALIAGVAQDQVAVFDRSDINRTILFGGVELTWTIFDGFESRGRRAAAMARKRLEEKRLERQEEVWEVGKVRLGEEMERAERELRFSQERVSLGARELRRREEDFERGLLAELDVQASRAVQAERVVGAARRGRDYLMAVAEYRSAAGRDPAMDYYLSRAER
jgi:outer membrane protein TolC